MKHQNHLITADLNINKDTTPILIETGTYQGEGSKAWSEIFDKVYTIELSDSLYSYCIETYKDVPNIEFLQGHSPDLLKDLVKNIDEPYTLFLDAHGSGGSTTFDSSVGRLRSPVLLELESVKNNIPKVIIIDDLTDFEQIDSYPSLDSITLKVSELGDYESSKYFPEGHTSKGMFVFKLK